MRRDLLSVLRVEIRRRLCGLAVAPEALSIVLVGLPVLDALGHFGSRGADLAAKNLLAAKERIEARLETVMDERDLYLPHFLGTNGAAKLLSSAEEKPDAKASKFFPKAARFNGSMFKAKGKQLTVGQFHQRMRSFIEARIGKYSDVETRVKAAALAPWTAADIENLVYGLGERLAGAVRR